jgi:protein-tyrosine-phosphatase
MKLLFICTGNTCRSPMAQAIANHLISVRGLKDIECQSAGLMARFGLPMSKNAVFALKKLGIPAIFHRSKPLTIDSVISADRIYVMETAHLQHLISRYPNTAAKTGIIPGGVPDPFGMDKDAYFNTALALKKAIETILEGL